jgi:hypothetical protein
VAEPVSVRTVRRVHHVTDTDVPPAERDETIETVAYFDGFRQLQTAPRLRTLAFGDPVSGDAGLPADQAQDPGDAGSRSACHTPPRVVVSGRQVYDNKGRVVE